MSRPCVVPGSQVCVAVHQNEIKIYGNTKALASIARQLEWISQARPEENYELHLRSHMGDFPNNTKEGESFFIVHENGVNCLQYTDRQDKIDGEDVTVLGLEITFMSVTDEQMEELRQYRKAGLLPEDE